MCTITSDLIYGLFGPLGIEVEVNCIALWDSTQYLYIGTVQFRNTNIKPSSYNSASSRFIKGAQYNNVIAMNMTVEQLLGLYSVF